ncbi:hypothetical protein GQL56_00335 [Pseudomonas putida]|nr:hypothetical protein [Pseudomonas putida]
MTDQLTQAQATLREAQQRYDDLKRASRMIGSQLPAAEQALNAARFKLYRAKTTTGAADQRECEIAALTAALNKAKGNSHV